MSSSTASASESTAIAATKSSDKSQPERSFAVVFIPADAKKPVEQWSVKYKAETEVSCLIDHIKPHFAKLGESSKAEMRKQVREQLIETMKKQNPTAPTQNIDDSFLDQVLQMSAVSCVPLQNNKRSTNYIGLMMYVDDQGMAKKLPVNERATRVCIDCGNPTQVLGDAFIARNFDDENTFRRIDFTLQEFESSQQWKYDAKRANAEKAVGADDQTKTLQDLVTQAQSAAAAAKTSQPESKMCANPACNRVGTLRCSRCKRSWYCSHDCQKADWKVHRKNVCIQEDKKDDKKDTSKKKGDSGGAKSTSKSDTPSSSVTSSDTVMPD